MTAQWSGVLLDKLIVAQTVNKFPAFMKPRAQYAFIRARQWTASALGQMSAPEF